MSNTAGVLYEAGIASNVVHLGLDGGVRVDQHRGPPRVWWLGPCWSAPWSTQGLMVGLVLINTVVHLGFYGGVRVDQQRGPPRVWWWGRVDQHRGPRVWWWGPCWSAPWSTQGLMVGVVLISTVVHPGFNGGVRVDHLLSFLCCVFLCFCFVLVFLHSVSSFQRCLCLWFVHNWW